jgi:SAM-dependent methyltransferase
MNAEQSDPHVRPDWRTLNRANWDERVPLHLAAPIYDSAPLRAGKARKNAIEEAELGSVDGLRLLHLQCHFGHDSLILAQRGASVVGLDFSPPAITAARSLAQELGLADRARFVEADLYDAPNVIPEPASFDRVYVSWGALCWLPDIAGWARIVAHFLKPGGSLYLAEGHPVAQVFDDATQQANRRPGFFVPYFHTEPLVLDDPTDYADVNARLTNSRTCEWIHPLGSVVSALIAAGLRLEWLHEHDAVPWHMFECLTKGPDGLFRWPDKPWLPLAYSLQATMPCVKPGTRLNKS